MEDMSGDENRDHVLEIEKVRRLDAFPQLLKKLASTFDSVHLELLACVSRLSLSDIPDEVVLSILQLACTDFRSVVDVSRVCKRFRRITLSSSRLWAGCPLTTCMPPHIIDMVASRSGLHGLTVEFEIGRQPIDVLTKLLEYSARWSAVEFARIQGLSRNKNLGALVSLVNKGPTHKLGSGWEKRAYENWTMPSLQFLSDNAWIPPPSFAEQVPSLVKYQIAPRLPDVAKLISFLNATQGLEELQLNIQCGETDDYLTTPAINMRSNLPALRKLQLTLPPTAWVYDDITLTEYLLRMILCPGITELTLRLGNEDRFTSTDGCIFGIKRGFTLIRDLCPCLERLSLTITGAAQREELYFIDDILQNLPRTIKHIDLSLGHINLWTHSVDTFPSVSESTHPRLTSLSIALHRHPRQDFFSTLAEFLQWRNIKLRALSVVYHENSESMEESAQRAFRTAGVLCDKDE